jgi:long-chain acyl-CoA synthetase
MHENPSTFPNSKAAQSQAATGRTDEHPWYAHYERGVPRSLTYRCEALYTWLDEAAECSPRKLACRFFNNKISYARMRKEAEIIAANLRKNGLLPGDRVGLMLPNLPQTILAFWGILKAGGVVTMINPVYMEKELLHQVHDSGLRHLVTIDLCWPKLEELRGQLNIEKFFITTIADGLRFPLNWLQRFKNQRNNCVKRPPYDDHAVLPFSVLRKGKERLSVPVENPHETLALLQYTGGTTGVSKGVMLTHFNLGANIQQSTAVLHCLKYQDQVIMGVAPFFHVYGLTTCVILPALLRAAVIPVPRYSPGDLLAAMQKYKVTVLPGAPAIYISLLQQKHVKKYSLAHLKYCVSGSAPMPVEYLRQFEKEFGAVFIEGYGLSEASPITHLNPALGTRKPGSIGLPFPDTNARIVDMEVGSIPMPTGKVGELIIRGPQVMSGYWNCPDETANTLRNGWLYTGDIATMDEDGYFTIVDRKKDMIIIGGYNVAPREIDEVIYEHPLVQEAVAVGVPHPTRGEIIKVYVVPRPGAVLEKSDIISWCRKRLANYKIPRQVEFREELPKTIVGKVLRRKLRAEELENQSCVYDDAAPDGQEHNDAEHEE